jgi:hypothetical protein
MAVSLMTSPHSSPRLHAITTRQPRFGTVAAVEVLLAQEGRHAQCL